MFKWVLSVLVLLSVLSAQKRWYRGNMEGMGEFTMDISVNGLEDPAWEDKVRQVTLLFLDQYKVKINPKRFSPILQLRFDILDSRVNPVSAYNIEISVMDFYVPHNEYTDNLQKKETVKSFKSGKIYERQVLGQVSSDMLREDMEKKLMILLDGFVDQWFRDNPIRQF